MIRLRGRKNESPRIGKPSVPADGGPSRVLGQTVKKRQFLKALLTGAGLAAVAEMGQVIVAPARAFATTIPDDLVVQGTGNSSFAGNLGIGTTIPGARLHVSGGSILLDNGYSLQMKRTSGSAIIDVLYVPGGSDSLVLKIPSSNDSNYLTIINTGGQNLFTLRPQYGNVGIGTTGPDSLVHLNDSAGIPTARAMLKVIRPNNISGGGTPQQAGLYIKTHDYPLHVENYAGTPALTANSLGRVGIGATNPGQKLHVYEYGGNVHPTVLVQGEGDGNCGARLELKRAVRTWSWWADSAIYFTNAEDTTKWVLGSMGQSNVGTNQPSSDFTLGYFNGAAWTLPMVVTTGGNVNMGASGALNIGSQKIADSSGSYYAP